MKKSRLSFLGQSWLFWLAVVLIFLLAQWVIMPRMTDFRKVSWIIFPCIFAIL